MSDTNKLREALERLCDEVAATEEHGDGAHDGSCPTCVAYALAREALAVKETCEHGKTDTQCAVCCGGMPAPVPGRCGMDASTAGLKTKPPFWLACIRPYGHSGPHVTPVPEDAARISELESKLMRVLETPCPAADVRCVRERRNAIMSPAPADAGGAAGEPCSCKRDGCDYDARAARAVMSPAHADAPKEER